MTHGACSGASSEHPEPEGHTRFPLLPRLSNMRSKTPGALLCTLLACCCCVWSASAVASRALLAQKQEGSAQDEDALLLAADPAAQSRRRLLQDDMQVSHCVTGERACCGAVSQRAGTVNTQTVLAHICLCFPFTTCLDTPQPAP